jgi:alpha-glucosidase
MLALYRAALATRRAEPALRGGALSWLESPSGVLAFGRTPPAGGPAMVVAVNLSGQAVPIPPGRPLLVSDPAAPAGTLPPDTAVWVRPPR